MPYNESFIDQASSVKIAGYWPRLFLRFMDLDFVSVHKNAKRELSQYPAILTLRLVNNIIYTIILLQINTVQECNNYYYTAVKTICMLYSYRNTGCQGVTCALASETRVKR